MGKEGDTVEQTGLNSVDLPNVVALLQGARSCSSRAVESLQQVFWWGAVVSRNTCSLTEESRGLRKRLVYLFCLSRAGLGHRVWVTGGITPFPCGQ